MENRQKNKSSAARMSYGVPAPEGRDQEFYHLMNKNYDADKSSPLRNSDTVRRIVVFVGIGSARTIPTEHGTKSLAALCSRNVP
jgi:hypothetical protein